MFPQRNTQYLPAAQPPKNSSNTNQQSGNLHTGRKRQHQPDHSSEASLHTTLQPKLLIPPPARYFTNPRHIDCNHYVFPYVSDITKPIPSAPGKEESGRNGGVWFTLEADGTLSGAIRVNLPGNTLRGHEHWKQLMEKFGNHILRIKDLWHDSAEFGDNFVSYHHYRAMGYSRVESAINTWTGRMAIREGYRSVTVISESAREVQVEFAWPGMSSQLNSPLDQIHTKKHLSPPFAQSFLPNNEPDSDDSGPLSF